MRKEKIDDLEIDLKELKYLLEGLDKEPMLARSAKRLIDLMKERLDDISSELSRPVKTGTAPAEEKTTYIEEVDLVKEESVTLEETVIALEVVDELSKGLTLNDTFRYSRELFDGDKDYMNKILQEISTMHSLADVVSYLSARIEWDEENEATKDFIELLKKHFV